MKTKIFFAFVIFVSLMVYFQGLPVGIIDPVALIDMPWDYEKTIIFVFTIVVAGVAASIPWWKQMLKYVFL